MTWISIKDQLPPEDGSLIYEYDCIYCPFVNYSNITLQHIQYDINNFGYSRVKYWAYKSTVEDTEGNVIEPEEEPKLEADKATAENVKDDERAKYKALDSWTSQNGKWTIEWSGKSKGSLVDNKTGKVYIWKYENEAVEAVGTKVPKYVENKIRELSK